MFQVCPGCGSWIQDYEIDVPGGSIRCPRCGTIQAFVFRPLRVLLGATGSGKTTVARAVVEKAAGAVVVLEQDILWSAEFDEPGDGYARFRDVWLRVAANVHQAHVSTLLVGSGVPDQFEPRPGRAWFSSSSYAAVVCTEDVLRERLLARPSWRDTHDESFIRRMAEYNEWLVSVGSRNDPSIALIDTSVDAVEVSARKVLGWLDHT